jgi:hypothetical protein
MASEIVAFEQALATSVVAAAPGDPATLAARARLGYAYVIADRFDVGVSALALYTPCYRVALASTAATGSAICASPTA